jgi:membrane associated rhomboid family serine protease
MSAFRPIQSSSFPPVIKNLLIINVLVYVAQLTLQTQLHLTDKIELHAILPPNLEGALAKTGELADMTSFNPYQLITYMFAHAPDNIGHIIFNMFALWMFGRILENLWGGKRFLFFYLASGVGAALLHLAIQYFRVSQAVHGLSPDQILQEIGSGNQAFILSIQRSISSALGASGAIMGIMAAFGYLFPNTELMIIPIPIPIKAKWLVLGYIALDLFGGITNSSGDNIAHFAHLGGAIAGFLIVYIWNKTNRKSLY